MKKNKEIKEEKNKCNCSEECDCGCQDGKECCCDDNCNCGCDEECTCDESNNDECNGCCESCHGCGEDLDQNTLINLLTIKNQDLEEKYVRLQAEYLNFKTRTQSEVSKMLKYEGEDLIKQILSIKDNFERAVILDDNDLNDEVSKFLSGFKMILGNLTNVLDNMEVKEIDCIGKEFDPHFEDAVLTEHDANKPENVVLEILTKGYMYKDKLIRPAMVKVNK